MQTNSTTQINNKILELQEWLRSNPAEHPSRPQIETDLRNLKLELANGRD
jgi:hypothetical protein